MQGILGTRLALSEYGAKRSSRKGTMTMASEHPMRWSLFFCQRLDLNQDVNRRELEIELGSSLRFHPMPCSGRIDVLHLLRVLEEGSDRVLVLTCPVGSCRYRQGNLRAAKRLDHARRLIQEVGLEPQRLELVAADPHPMNIGELLRPLLARPWPLGSSPLARDRSLQKDSGGIDP